MGNNIDKCMCCNAEDENQLSFDRSMTPNPVDSSRIIEARKEQQEILLTSEEYNNLYRVLVGFLGRKQLRLSKAR